MIWLPAAIDEHGMEVSVEVGEPVGVTAPGTGPLLVQHGRHLLGDPGMYSAADDCRRGKPLEERLDDVVDLVRGDGNDHRTALGIQPQEPLGLQPQERLAGGRARDADLVGELSLDRVLASLRRCRNER
jgi:hypothetical protein